MTGSLDFERHQAHEEAVNAWHDRHAPIDGVYFTVQLDGKTWWALSALAEQTGTTIPQAIAHLAAEAAS